MSRIQRPRVQGGDASSAAELNNTYSDYSQLGDLDGNNVRDQAFDLPHFDGYKIVKNNTETILGNQVMLHPVIPAQAPPPPATWTEVTHTTTIASPQHHVVQTLGGVETFLDLSSSPWVIATGDVIRVWWHLSVLSEYTALAWDGVSSLGRYLLPDPAGGNEVITDGHHCWVMYLEWDITSAGLTNWVPVPGQSSFTTDLFSETQKGALLYETSSTVAISPWAVFSEGNAENGETPDRGSSTSHGWYAPYGMWAHANTGAGFSVYGIRVVITGLLHPAHSGGVNYLIYDVNTACTLKYLGGRIGALHQLAD